MDNKDKHNLFSKEELFKLIDEKRSLPPEADDFDKEAMEGLSMVTDRRKLEKLDEAIDEVLRREAEKAKKKRNIYFLSAAASLILIMGLFFLLKDGGMMKEDKNLAQNNPEKTEDIVSADKAEEKPAATPPVSTVDKDIASGENLKGKENFKEGKLAEQSGKGESFGAGAAGTTPAPVDEVANTVTLANKEKSEKTASGDVTLDRPDLDGNLEDKKSGGKAKQDNQDLRGALDLESQKKESAKKPEEKKLYKANEADEKKVRYETNTVWTSSSTATDSKKVADELKQQQTVTEVKPGVAVQSDDQKQPVNTKSTVTSANNATPVQTQEEAVVMGGTGKDEDKSKVDAPAKNLETVSTVQRVQNGPFSKKHRSKSRKTRAVSAAYEPPAAKVAENERAGYSYYSQTSTRDFTSPSFTGGEAALQEFVKENLKFSAPDKNGTVVSEFTVKEDGSIDTAAIKIITPIKKCDPCSKDVKELVKKMPKWQPARENGKPKEYRQKLSVSYDPKAVKK